MYTVIYQSGRFRAVLSSTAKKYGLAALGSYSTIRKAEAAAIDFNRARQIERITEQGTPATLEAAPDPAGVPTVEELSRIFHGRSMKNE